jgi:histidinol dehydrogenase
VLRASVRVRRSELVGQLARMSSIDQYIDRVRGIVNEVRDHGDEALVRLTREFDKVELRGVELSGDELSRLAGQVDPRVKDALEESIRSVEALNGRIKPPDVEDYYMGLRRVVRWVPVRRIGVYVPKGYFSTLVMTGVLARVAGVEEVIVATPPKPDGSVDPELAYLALRINARVFRVGGAQAIAAMAFGTESVPRVDKVVGPGNIYVQAAKVLVSSHVGIDGVEGPTELVTCADPSIKPGLVAADLAAQLEHSGAVGVLVTWSEDYLSRVEAELGKLTNAPYLSTLVNEPRECVDVINEISPEHASIWGSNVPIGEIRNAGAVSHLAPSALVDYVAGPSHVLPTSGSSRWRGVLTPIDFMKPIAYVTPVNSNAAVKLGEQAVVIGLREGFRRHADSIIRWISEQTPSNA